MDKKAIMYEVSEDTGHGLIGDTVLMENPHSDKDGTIPHHNAHDTILHVTGLAETKTLHETTEYTSGSNLTTGETKLKQLNPTTKT